jgi:hypothetical protein
VIRESKANLVTPRLQRLAVASAAASATILVTPPLKFLALASPAASE